MGIRSHLIADRGYQVRSSVINQCHSTFPLCRKKEVPPAPVTPVSRPPPTLTMAYYTTDKVEHHTPLFFTKYILQAGQPRGKGVYPKHKTQVFRSARLAADLPVPAPHVCPQPYCSVHPATSAPPAAAHLKNPTTVPILPLEQEQEK